MKGQSAFELLSTYGWALLLIAVVASTIAYLGLVSPSDYLNENCQLGAEFGCEDYALILNSTNSTTVIALRNKNAEPVKPVSSIICEYKNSTSIVTFDSYLMPGEIRQFNCTGPIQDWTVGEKRKVNFKIIYYLNKTTPGIPRATNGFIFGEVK